jgi:hypothetical protein
MGLQYHQISMQKRTTKKLDLGCVPNQTPLDGSHEERYTKINAI